MYRVDRASARNQYCKVMPKVCTAEFKESEVCR
jgi:hypothetical protein